MGWGFLVLRKPDVGDGGMPAFTLTLALCSECVSRFASALSSTDRRGVR